jgi:probable phosphoglycerate mutase
MIVEILIDIGNRIYQKFGDQIFGILSILLVLFVYVRHRLSTKRVFFVRHGRSILNEQHIRQSREGGLSEAGKAEAEIAGKFLAQVHIKKLYVSPYERTKETAQIINTHLHVPIVYSELLIERRNPSEIIGKKADDPEVKKIVDHIDLSYHDDSYRYSDEENFMDMKQRAKKCLRYLETRWPNNIAVITHGIYLKMLLAYMLRGKRLHTPEYVKLSFFNPADNGRVTLCEYHPWKRWFSRTGGWEILTYNDQFQE